MDRFKNFKLQTVAIDKFRKNSSKIQPILIKMNLKKFLKNINRNEQKKNYQSRGLCINKKK